MNLNMSSTKYVYKSHVFSMYKLDLTLNKLLWFGLIWFGLVLWHINHCRLFNAKSTFIYINSYISNNSIQNKYIFFVYAQLNVKIVLFQTIQFNVQKSSISNNSVKNKYTF